MSNLVIIPFKGRHTADEALLRVAKMDADWEAVINDFIVVTRDAAGEIRVKNSDALAATGMLGGGALGSLTGMMIGALAGNPAAGLLIGAAAGTGVGTLAGALDQAGEEDALAARLGAKLTKDSSALAMIGWTDRPTKLLGELEGMQGEVIETTLSVSDEKELRAALNAN